jgi:hypothetical protein
MLAVLICALGSASAAWALGEPSYILRCSNGIEASSDSLMFLGTVLLQHASSDNCTIALRKEPSIVSEQAPGSTHAPSRIAATIDDARTPTNDASTSVRQVSPLVGNSEPTCDLCAHDWLFVLSTGRAGSTSIMQAINNLPGVHVSLYQ